MKGIHPNDVAAFAREHELAQVIVVGWGANGLTHVVTWGESLQDSAQAAQGGNFVKNALGFPDADCRTLAPRMLRALAFYGQAGEPWETRPAGEPEGAAAGPPGGDNPTTPPLGGASAAESPAADVDEPA